MRKYGAILLALILVLPLCYVYLANGNAERNLHAPKDNSSVDRIQMKASLTGDARTAKISMHSVNEDDKAKGYVNIPFSKRYLSSSVRIIATASQPGNEITCKIYDID